MRRYNVSSLRTLFLAGERADPPSIDWAERHAAVPIIDHWWQTETGGIMISPLPYATVLKPGSATRPMPGIDAAILTEEGELASTNEGGHLVVRQPWPGMLRGIYGDQERYKSTYFAEFPGFYDAGDGARCDEDGYFWIMGRIDDVLNVAGHRLSTIEIESALVSHPAVAEAAADRRHGVE